MRARLAMVAVLLCCGVAAAQPGNPSAAYVYPAGGQRGTTFQAVVGGQFLGGVSAVEVSGQGVQVRIVDKPRILTQVQINEMRQQIKVLTDKQRAAATSRPGVPALTADERAKLIDLVRAMAIFGRRREAPSLGETVTVEITIAADAPVGRRYLRVRTGQGLSGPLAFCVGSLPEVSHPPVAPSQMLAVTGMDRLGRLRELIEPRTPDDVLTLPVVVNGQIIPAETDRHRFSAKKGQRIVVAVAARELIPYMADAVPGWFDAVVTVRDSKGNRLAWADDDRCHPDPVLSFVAPADGEYAVEIRDALYRGRENFVYRITIGELPLVRSMFPLGGQPGVPTTVRLEGWNLTEAAMRLVGQERGFLPVQGAAQESLDGRLLFAADPLPVALEKSGDASAQAVSLPVIIDGRIDQPGDRDVYSFSGRAGQQVVAEVMARRLGSPLDSAIQLVDSAGKVLAANDDTPDKCWGLVTHQADSRLLATLPASGTYFVHIIDVQGKGGEAYAYRLRISEPRPDFALRISPSVVNLRAGATAVVTVHAQRYDGFAGPIELSLKGAPAGFVLAGNRIPAGQDQVRCTLTASARPRAEPYVLTCEGRATVGASQIVRTAVAAEDMMQAFLYRHLVDMGPWQVCVSGRGIPRPADLVLTRQPVRLTPGGTAAVETNLPSQGAMGKFILELSEPPAGVHVERVVGEGRRSRLVLRADADAAKPGTAGNLIVNAYLERAVTPPPSTGPSPRPTTAPAAPPVVRKVPLGVLPAIPFEVVAR